MGNCCCKCINKYISPKACHWCTFIFYHFRIISWSRFLIGGEMLNLERFPLSVLPCALCMHGLCSADVTAGGEPNPVSHTDSRAVLSALYWRWCALIRLEGQSELFFFSFLEDVIPLKHFMIRDRQSVSGGLRQNRTQDFLHLNSPPLIPTRLNDQIYLYHISFHGALRCWNNEPLERFSTTGLLHHVWEKRNDCTEDTFRWH